MSESQPQPAWAVLAPDGAVTWHPLTDEVEVERIVGGRHGALDRRFVLPDGRCPLRLVASDVARIFPEDYPANELAGLVLAILSQGKLVQAWRGHVALVCYDRDPGTGEWLWPGEMDPAWGLRVRAAITVAQGR